MEPQERTIFKKIIDREIPADIVFETDEVLAFKDIHPQAPTHILVIPKKELTGVAAAKDDDRELLGSLLLAARDIAQELGLVEQGYRLVINQGAAAGQTVFHLHLHILSGREMQWPPG